MPPNVDASDESRTRRIRIISREPEYALFQMTKMKKISTDKIIRYNPYKYSGVIENPTPSSRAKKSVDGKPAVSIAGHGHTVH